MPKIVYVDYTMHDKSQLKAENIYRVPIYIYTRLGLGVYSLHIFIYTNLKAYTQSTVYIYMCVCICVCVYVCVCVCGGGGTHTIGRCHSLLYFLNQFHCWTKPGTSCHFLSCYTSIEVGAEGPAHAQLSY